MCLTYNSHYAQPALKELMNLWGKWDHVSLGEKTRMQLLFHIFVHSKLLTPRRNLRTFRLYFQVIFLFVYKSCILAWAENFLKYINKSLFTVRGSRWSFFFSFLTNNTHGFPVLKLCFLTNVKLSLSFFSRWSRAEKDLIWQAMALNQSIL